MKFLPFLSVMALLFSSGPGWAQSGEQVFQARVSWKDVLSCAPYAPNPADYEELRMDTTNLLAAFPVNSLLPGHQFPALPLRKGACAEVMQRLETEAQGQNGVFRKLKITRTEREEAIYSRGGDECQMVLTEWLEFQWEFFGPLVESVVRMPLSGTGPCSGEGGSDY
jgi:hypothetical protein